ncbi:hypothetical protein Tco_0998720 [Tanacetum coccineum]
MYSRNKGWKPSFYADSDHAVEDFVDRKSSKLVNVHSWDVASHVVLQEGANRLDIFHKTLKPNMFPPEKLANKLYG